MGRGVAQSTQTVQGLIDNFNAQGAQIVLRDGPTGKPQLHGLVADSTMRHRLEHELQVTGFRVGVQLHDARQMAESLTRLALLADQHCEARHLGGGRFECDAGVVDSEGLANLHTLASQVPGVVDLQVRALKPLQATVVAVAPAAPEPEPVAVVVPPAPKPFQALPVIRNVAVGARSSFAYDGRGRKLRVGDRVDGATVTRIQLSGVEFMRDEQRYMVGVTPVLLAAAPLATH